MTDPNKEPDFVQLANTPLTCHYCSKFMGNISIKTEMASSEELVSALKKLAEYPDSVWAICDNCAVTQQKYNN
jgi:hypothetical protein